MVVGCCNCSRAATRMPTLPHEPSSITSVVTAQVEPNFTNLVMAIVVLEGLGRQLDPSLDLFSIALELMPTLLLD